MWVSKRVPTGRREMRSRVDCGRRDGRLPFGAMWFIALLVTIGCGSTPEDTASVCPPPTDSCMNEENHQECLDVEATCTGYVSVMESCPLQFGCED